MNMSAGTATFAASIGASSSSSTSTPEEVNAAFDFDSVAARAKELKIPNYGADMTLGHDSESKVEGPKPK